MPNNKNRKEIFIGGTGRSGTSILSKYLGSHIDVYQIPFESKFLVDKDGALDLFTALTINFNIVQGKVAIHRFENLINKVMSDPFSAPYIGYNLKWHTSPKHLDKHLSQLITAISSGKWHGWDKHTQDKHQVLLRVIRILVRGINKISIDPINRYISPKEYNIPQINYKKIRTKEWGYIPKYFVDETELQVLLGKFIESLFYKMAIDNNKKIFCEATPANMLHVDFLSSIFPNAYFLHAVRHPIGVAQSMLESKRLWAPNDAEGVVNYLIPLYEKLIVMEKYAVKNNVNYKIVKLEDCCHEETIHELNHFLGIDSLYNGEVSFNLTKVNYWNKTLLSETSDYFKDKLSKYINHYGY